MLPNPLARLDRPRGLLQETVVTGDDNAAATQRSRSSQA
jgi:hypothetical protein